MQYTLRTEECGEIPLTSCIPETLQDFVLPGASRASCIGTFGEMMRQQTQTHSYEIVVYNYFLTRPASFIYTETENVNTAYLQFNLSGSTRYSHFADHNDNRIFREREFNLTYHINPQQTIHFDEPGLYTLIKVSCARDILYSLKGLNFAIDNCLAAIYRNQRILCWPVNQVTPYKVLHLLRRLFHPPVSAPLYEQYNRIKTIEIGLETLLHTAHNGNRTAVSLTKQQIEDIYSIKVFLLANPASRFTTAELSEGTSLTAHTLKRGFRTLFGTGIYNFAATARMEKSIELMRQEKHINTSRLARLLGYEDEMSFLVAFKKHFGCNPMYFSL